MELTSWKRRYPEDVQGYVKLNSNSIPFKADIDYTGMFKSITFPMDTRFSGDLIRVRGIGFLGLFNHCKFSGNLKGTVIACDPVVGGVLFVGCDFSDVRTGMITIKASDRRIPGVFNSCMMPTNGVMGVDFLPNRNDNKYSIHCLFRGIRFDDNVVIASLPRSSCADLNDVFTDCKFDDSKSLSRFSLDNIEKFSHCSLFNNCSFANDFRLNPNYFCSDISKISHTDSRIFKSCSIGGEKLENVVGIHKKYLLGMMSQDSEERLSCTTVVNEKLLEWMMLSPSIETLKGRFALTVKNLIEGGLDESDAIALARSMKYYSGISYTRSVKPLLEKRIHSYLSDIDKDGFSRYNIGEVRERLLAEGFEISEIEHGIIEAISSEYLVV